MDSIWSRCKPKLIPDISDGDLDAMMQAILPLSMNEDGRFREILTDGVDRRLTAFTWSPRLGRPVRVYRGGLDDITILTFHTWAYYGLFKPTLAEVHACIMAFVPDWHLVRFFWLDSRGMDHRNIVGDFHWCPCVLFGEEMGNVIDPEWDAFVATCSTEDGE